MWNVILWSHTIGARNFSAAFCNGDAADCLTEEDTGCHSYTEESEI